MSDLEGKRRFSIAMLALESGDFAKCEKMLTETIDILGKEHHTALLAMKTLSGIASESGRYDDAIKVSLDLLETQMRLYGVNHNETHRTVKSIMEICKQSGKEDTAYEISEMVHDAADRERNESTQSFKRLRSSTEKNVEEEGLRHKIALLIARLFGKFLKKLPQETGMPGKLALAALVMLFVGAYASFFVLNMGATGEGSIQLRRRSISYDTMDQSKSLEFIFPCDVIVHAGNEKYKVPYRVFGYDWHEIGTLFTTSFLNKEEWLTEKKQGIVDSNGTVFYKSDASEKDIVHQMVELNATANYFCQNKSHYPSDTAQISKTKFQYLNPFTKKMDTPTIDVVNLEGQGKETVNQFINSAQTSMWPAERPLYPGAIHCCWLTCTSEKREQQQMFWVHGCDRDGALIAGNDNKVLVLSGLNGSIVIPKPEESSSPLRTPTFNIIKAPADVVNVLIQILKFRFCIFYGIFALLLGFVSSMLGGEKEKSIALLLALLAAISALLALGNILIG